MAAATLKADKDLGLKMASTICSFYISGFGELVYKQCNHRLIILQ